MTVTVTVTVISGRDQWAVRRALKREASVRPPNGTSGSESSSRRTRSDLVPEYSQLVVDGISGLLPHGGCANKVLATKSPSLIVGDDDQALYAFRDASPAAIRELATGGEYTKFALPFCTRCTEVLVDATHAVVERAQSTGLLAGRLTKPYVCYMPEKPRRVNGFQRSETSTARSRHRSAPTWPCSSNPLLER